MWQVFLILSISKDKEKNRRYLTGTVFTSKSFLWDQGIWLLRHSWTLIKHLHGRAMRHSETQQKYRKIIKGKVVSHSSGTSHYNNNSNGSNEVILKLAKVKEKHLKGLKCKTLLSLPKTCTGDPSWQNEWEGPLWVSSNFQTVEDK